MKKEVYSATSLPEADLIKSFLESRGIKCLIWDKNIGAAYPPVTLGSGIRIVVDEKDYKEAKQIIGEYLQEKKD